MAPRRRLCVLFALLLLTFGYFYQSGQHNENCRLDQIGDVCEYGRLDIDLNYSNSADIVQVGGHYYPGKAPGTTLVGVPWWFVSRRLLGLFNPPRWRLQHFTCYLTTWGTVGVPAAAQGTALFVVLNDMLGEPLPALLLALALALGTIELPYATLLFGHDLSSAALFGSFALLWRRRWVPWAGALALAMITDYPVGVGVLPLVVFAGYRLGRRDLLRYLGGLVVALLTLAAYNQAAFHNPFYIPYEYYAQAADSQFTEHRIGFLGVHWPDWHVLLNITCMPQRGLFYCNPWLVLLFPGLWWGWRGRYRAETLLSAAVVGAFLLFNASLGTSIVTWGGGTATGPRQVIPMLPFATVLVAQLFESRVWRWAFYPLMAVSVSFMLMATAVDPRAGYQYRNPLVDDFLPNYLAGHYARCWSGTFNPIFLTANSVAFNLGKLAGLAPSVQLLPLLLLWGVGIAWLSRDLAGRAALWWATAAWVGVMAVMPLAGTPAAPGAGVVQSVWRGDHVLAEPPPPRYRMLTSGTMPQRSGAPLPDLSQLQRAGVAPPYAVEWSGWLSVTSPGAYLFRIESNAPACLYLDGQLLVDGWTPNPDADQQASRILAAGRHMLNVRCQTRSDDSYLHILWQPPTQDFQLLPLDAVFPQPPVGGGR